MVSWGRLATCGGLAIRLAADERGGRQFTLPPREVTNRWRFAELETDQEGGLPTRRRLPNLPHE